MTKTSLHLRLKRSVNMILLNYWFGDITCCLNWSWCQKTWAWEPRHSFPNQNSRGDLTNHKPAFLLPALLDINRTGGRNYHSFHRVKPYLTYLWELLEAIPTPGAIQSLSGPSQPQAPLSKLAPLSVGNWARQPPRVPSDLNSTLFYSHNDEENASMLYNN